MLPAAAPLGWDSVLYQNQIHYKACCSRGCLSDHTLGLIVQMCFVFGFRSRASDLHIPRYGGTRQAISQNPGAQWTIQQLLRLRPTNAILIKAEFYFPTCFSATECNMIFNSTFIYSCFSLFFFFLLVSSSLSYFPSLFFIIFLFFFNPSHSFPFDIHLVFEHYVPDTSEFLF